MKDQNYTVLLRPTHHDLNKIPLEFSVTNQILIYVLV